MQRIFYCTVIACLLLLANTSATPNASSKNAAQSSLLNYCWFTDEYLSNPTGTFGEMATEIARLRSLYPGYTFTNQSASNLVKFEYGYYPNHPAVIIYSNLNPGLSDLQKQCK